MAGFFLETWVHDLIRKTASQDAEYSKHLDVIKSRDITREDIDAFQLVALRQVMSHAYSNSTFYRKLFDKNGIKPEKITTPSDFAQVPFTMPAYLREEPYKVLSAPLGDIARLFTFDTSGTTGRPKKVFFTQSELDNITDFMGAAIKSVVLSAGIQQDDYVVQVQLPDGAPTSQAGLLSTGIRKIGATPSQVELMATIEAKIENIIKVNPVMLFSPTPSTYRMTQLANQKYNLKDMGLKIIFVTSFHVSQAMREQMENIWGVKVYVHYGMTEMGLAGAIECQAHDGFHFNETDFLFEIIDPETGKVLENEQEGELVLTTLSRRGMPLIRYRTGDISTLTDKPCSCGVTTLKRIGKVVRKLSSIVKIGADDTIDPITFDNIIYRFTGVIDYEVVLTNVEGKEHLTFQLETIDNIKVTEDEVARALMAHPLIQKNVTNGSIDNITAEMVPVGGLQRTGRAKKLIRDHRTAAIQ